MQAAGVACTLAALALAAGVAGCDAQADQDYLGEPLVTLHGQVTGTPPLPPVEAAMLWQRGPPPSTGDQELATRAPVDASFPATFTIHLYQPPPSAARRTLRSGEVPFARGNAAAVPFGIVAYSVPALPGAQNPSYGVDQHHWVIHLEANVPPGSLMEWWLGAALPAGYHLVRVETIDPCPNLAECVAALVSLGIPDDGTADPGTARGFCLAPYRLSPAPADELIVLELGTDALAPGDGGCP